MTAYGMADRLTLTVLSVFRYLLVFDWTRKMAEGFFEAVP